MDLLRCTDLLVIERDFESQNWKKFKRRGEILNVFLDPGRQIPQAIPQGTKKPLTNLPTVKGFRFKLWYLQESNQGHMDFQSIALPTELRYQP